MNIPVIYIIVLMTLLSVAIALYIRRKSSIETKATNFITVFTDTIHILETKGALFPTAKMKELIKSHELAAIELRNSLDWWNTRKFNRYWKNYRKKADKYYYAPAKLGFPATNKEMVDDITNLIKKVKRL